MNSDVYKIALISTHATGKSVLSVDVSAALGKRGLTSIALGEFSTQAKKTGLTINEETTLAAQLWILHQQFSQEIDYSENQIIRHDILVCDRGGPDNYCYIRYNLGDNQYALDMVLGHMKLYPYSRFYLLPIVNQDGEIPVGTGARSRDKIKRAEVFGVIGGFLEEYDIDHIKLPIPQENDHYREEWTRIIVNQTLKDLGEPEHLYMK